MTRRIAVARTGVDAADVSNEAIARRLASGERFWLDLHGLDDDDLALLRDTFGLHPLVLEDVQTQGQRAKVEEYDDVTYMVAFGATPPPDEDRLVEVHLLYSEHFLVTLHRDASPAIDEVVRRCSVRPELLEKAPLLLYRVLDALTDSFFPAMDELDARHRRDRRRAGRDAPRRAAARDLRAPPPRRRPPAGRHAAARPGLADRIRRRRDPRR